MSTLTSQETIPHIHLESGTSSLTVTPYGAHALSWKHRGIEQLFMSDRAEFKAPAAIRGGIPIIFPWFGKLGGQATAHGFARNMNWDVIALDKSLASVSFELTSRDVPSEKWSRAFAFRLTYQLGDSLKTELQIKNESSETTDYQVALHTYFFVDALSEVTVEGLTGLHFLDNAVPGLPKKKEENNAVRFEGLIDRIYINAAEKTRLRASASRTVKISSSLPDRVIWNPGEKVCATMKDLAPDGYTRFVCVETGAIATPVSLAPGEIYHAHQELVIQTN